MATPYSSGNVTPLAQPAPDTDEMPVVRKIGLSDLHDALRLGWDRVHQRLGLTKLFYDRFTPALAASDFAIRPGRLDNALDFLAVCRA